MSRLVKRVPLDFDHPEWEAWPGYSDPHKPDVDPPTGEGFQLWEMNRIGAPVSPVFASAAELAEWMLENDYLPHQANQVRRGEEFLDSSWSKIRIR